MISLILTCLEDIPQCNYKKLHWGTETSLSSEVCYIKSELCHSHSRAQVACAFSVGESYTNYSDAKIVGICKLMNTEVSG